MLTADYSVLFSLSLIFHMSATLMHAHGRYVNHETCIATVYYDPSRLRRRNKANPPAASCPWLSLHCHAIQQYAISSSFLFNLSLCHYSNLSTTPSSSVFILSFLPSTPSYCGSLSLSVALPSNRYSVTQQPF